MEQCLFEWKVRCETDRFTSSETHSSAKARRYRKREREDETQNCGSDLILLLVLAIERGGIEERLNYFWLWAAGSMPRLFAPQDNASPHPHFCLSANHPCPLFVLRRSRSCFDTGLRSCSEGSRGGKDACGTAQASKTVSTCCVVVATPKRRKAEFIYRLGVRRVLCFFFPLFTLGAVTLLKGRGIVFFLERIPIQSGTAAEERSVICMSERREVERKKACIDGSEMRFEAGLIMALCSRAASASVTFPPDNGCLAGWLLSVHHPLFQDPQQTTHIHTHHLPFPPAPSSSLPLTRCCCCRLPSQLRTYFVPRTRVCHRRGILLCFPCSPFPFPSPSFLSRFVSSSLLGFLIVDPLDLPLPSLWTTSFMRAAAGPSALSSHLP